MIMRKLVSKSFVVLSLLYLQVNGIIFDHEYFPGGRIILTGCCSLVDGEDRVVNVTWLLSNKNLSNPGVTVENVYPYRLEIDSLSEEYNASIIKCTAIDADHSKCEHQWRLLAKDVATTAQSPNPDTDNTSPSPSPAPGDSTTPGLNPVTGSSEFSGKNATSTMSMVIPVVVGVVAAVVVMVMVLFVLFYISKRKDKNETETVETSHNESRDETQSLDVTQSNDVTQSTQSHDETQSLDVTQSTQSLEVTQEVSFEYESDYERDGIFSRKDSSGKPRKRTVVNRGHQDENGNDENTQSSLRPFTDEVSESDLPSSAVTDVPSGTHPQDGIVSLTETVQSWQTNSAVLCSQMSTDGMHQPVIVCVEKNVDRSNMAMIGENFLVPADTISN